MQNPKLDKTAWKVGETKTLVFSGAEPFATGIGKWGPWAGYEVTVDGTIRSYFPPTMLLETLAKLLPRTRTIAIKLGAKQGEKGLLNDWTCWAADAPPASAADTRDKTTRDFDNDLMRDDAKAAVDRKELSIARAVALKAAVDYYARCEQIAGEELSDDEAVTMLADKFVAWLTK